AGAASARAGIIRAADASRHGARRLDLALYMTSPLVAARGIQGHEARGSYHTEPGRRSRPGGPWRAGQGVSCREHRPRQAARGHRGSVDPACRPEHRPGCQEPHAESDCAIAAHRRSQQSMGEDMPMLRVHDQALHGTERDESRFDRRSFLAAGAAAAATTALAGPALAQTQGWAVGPEPGRYPSGAWLVHDDRFRKYMIGNTPLIREWTGSLWAEGPAWNGVGRYVVFSDIPNNRQMRWDEVTGEVTLLRTPSNFSNGNTCDFEGRQISCEHQTARVVRYEYEGEPTVLADSYDGKPLNAPNDAVVHPDDGGILFTDPGYGSHWFYEGNVRELELPTSVYHIDAQGGKVTKLTDEIFKPNGLCFSPDYSILYVADTAPTHHPVEKAKIIAWDVEDNGRRLDRKS